MAFALIDSEPATTGIVRVLGEEMANAKAHLDAENENYDERIHECRKHLKKSRSLLRAVSSRLPTRMRKKAFQELRRAAHELAGFREQAANSECIEAVMRRTRENREKRALRVIKKAIKDNINASVEDIALSFEKARSRIITAQKETEMWNGEGLSLGLMGDGAAVSYNKARKAFKRCMKQGTPDHYHQWRKRSKDLRYQIKLVAGAWPACLNAMEQALHALTDHLGFIHDAALLLTALEQCGMTPLSEKDRLAAATTILREYNAAQKEALRLGARIFAEPPSGFSTRIHRYLDAWAAENDPIM